MDLIVKIAIGMFIFCMFLIFFKVTKKAAKKELDKRDAFKINIDEILNRDYEVQKLEQESRLPFDIPLNHLDSLNPNDINWVVKN